MNFNYSVGWIKSVLRPALKALKLSKLRFSFFVKPAKVRFKCNICGWVGFAPLSAISQREQPSCCGCGSTLRFRSIVAALTKEFFGEIVPLKQLSTNKNLCGIGMSDAEIYASVLQEKFSYINTFYDREPRLDATDLTSWAGAEFDFIISSDVYEHIPHPVDIAFKNLYKLLKKGGVCIFSAPFDVMGDTKEHFPTLQKWAIESRDGKRVLVNLTNDGRTEVFSELRFHGGSGATLEMRRFGQSDLLRYFESAGFRDVRIYGNDIPEYGIIFADRDSFIISARK